METSRLAQLVRGSDVETVMVQGELLMEDRKVLTVNEDDIMEWAQAEAEHTWEVFGLHPDPAAVGTPLAPSAGVAAITSALHDSGRQDMTERVDILIDGGTVVTMDPERRVLEDTSVAVDRRHHSRHRTGRRTAPRDTRPTRPFQRVGASSCRG